MVSLTVVSRMIDRQGLGDLDFENAPWDINLVPYFCSSGSISRDDVPS